MEPVFIILGESAATVACLAINDDVAVQDVDIEKLQFILLAGKQVCFRRRNCQQLSRIVLKHKRHLACTHIDARRRRLNRLAR